MCPHISIILEDNLLPKKLLSITLDPHKKGETQWNVFISSTSPLCRIIVTANKCQTKKCVRLTSTEGRGDATAALRFIHIARY